MLVQENFHPLLNGDAATVVDQVCMQEFSRVQN
jgi:hypothetical protein